jgi:hypothetical protein
MLRLARWFRKICDTVTGGSVLVYGRHPPVSVMNFGPSGVRALPLAAGINEGVHYFRYFSFFSYHRYSNPQKGMS